MTAGKQERKERPIARGALDYFPDAIAEVAHTSYIGNQQHNPGEELHWSKGKSDDHADCIARHLLDRGKLDDDGVRHSAKVAWRALALLQTEIEEEQEANDAALPLTQTWKMVPENIAPFPDFVRPKSFDPHVDFMATLTQPEKFKEPPSILSELVDMGCDLRVAKQIVGGLTYGNLLFCKHPATWVYVAGPMRGRKDFNFPAFDLLRNELAGKGYNVISSADIDRADGFKEKTDKAADSCTYAMRDFWALYYVAKKGGAIALLPGWEKSIGASAEAALAKWMGLKKLNHLGEPYQEVE